MRGNPTAKAGETNDAIHGWSAWNFKPGAFSGADKLDQPENGLRKRKEGRRNKEMSVSVGVQLKGGKGKKGGGLKDCHASKSYHVDEIRRARLAAWLIWAN